MEAICSSETLHISTKLHCVIVFFVLISSEILVHHQHELHAPGVLMMLADV